MESCRFQMIDPSRLKTLGLAMPARLTPAAPPMR
jgi:hypothetical protein